MDISVPHEWAQFIRGCCLDNPFKVHEMKFTDFLNMSSLVIGKDSPFVNRKKDFDGNKFLISKIVHLQVRSDRLGTLFF